MFSRETKHVRLSSLWIHECLEHLSQNGPWSLEIGLLSNYVYNAFLCTDLRLSALKEVLPPDIKVSSLPLLSSDKLPC